MLHFVAFDPGPQGIHVISRNNVAFSDLPSYLEHRVLPDKHAGNLISFAEYVPGETRGEDGIQCLYAVVLDFDGLAPGTSDRLQAHFSSLGLAHWVYTSFSHRDVGKTVKHTQTGVVTPGPFDCVRALFPLDRPVSTSEWKHLAPLFIEDVVPAWFVAEYPDPARTKRGLDPASLKPAQGWYSPSCPAYLLDQAVNDATDGAPIDVAHYLRRAPKQAPRPGSSTSAPIDRIHGALTALGRQIHETSPGQFAACCPSHPDSNPSFGYTEGDDGRVIMRCLAGCSTQTIVSALGLAMRDLFVQLPEIVVTTKEHQVTDEAAAALASDAQLYQRAGRLVTVVNDPDVGFHVRPLEPASVRDRLTACAQFVTIKHDKEGNEIHVSTHPPEWCVQALFRRGEWQGVKSLSGLIHAPTLRPDCSLLSTPGYDAVTRQFLTRTLPLTVPEYAPRELAHVAAQTLLGLVADFPFVDDVDRAVWLSLVLTRCARAAVEGNTPMFAITATTPGTGKTLLAELACLIATGSSPHMQSFPRDDDELRKSLHASALEATDCIFFDNIAAGQRLGGAPLDLALTTGKLSGRVLGKSETGTGLLRGTWIATGNNLQVSGDLARRALHCRLATDRPDPHNRDDFQLPDVKGFVVKHQAPLLACALTILRAYHQAGRPLLARRLGSFEAWAELVAGAVMWVGLPDPSGSQKLAEEAQVDEQAIARLAIVEHLWESRETKPEGMLAAELAFEDRLREVVEGAIDGTGQNGAVTPKQLGRFLMRTRGMVFEVQGQLVVLDCSNDRRACKLWYMRPAPKRSR